MYVPLDVSGELSVAGEDGEQFQLEGCGDAIAVKLPDLATGRALARQTSGRAKRQAAMRKLHTSLQKSDLKLRVLVAGTLVAHLYPDSKATVLSRILGLAPMKLKPLSLLGAVFRRSA